MAYIVKIDDSQFKVSVEKREADFRILLGDKEYHAEILSQQGTSRMTIAVNRTPFAVFFDKDGHMFVNGESYSFEVLDELVHKLIKSAPASVRAKELTVCAPMPGLVIEVEVSEGDAVKSGKGLVIVEAMKMQNEMKAPRDGIVKRVLVQKGQTVNGKDALIIIE